MLRSAEQTGLPRPQVYERIAEHVMLDVRAGTLCPGERLPAERELARRLGVARASVREAIAALQVDGILETRPGSGSYVAADAPRRVGERVAAPGLAERDVSPVALLEARALFEPRIAALAARRADRDHVAERLLDAIEAHADDRAQAGQPSWNDADRHFHHRLAVLTDNAVLEALARHVCEVMAQPLWQRLREEAVPDAAVRRRHAADHRFIYEAVVAGDADAAEHLAAEHLARVRRGMTLN